MGTRQGKKEKERALRSHLKSVPRLCGCSSTRKAVSLVDENCAATCKRQQLEHAQQQQLQQGAWATGETAEHQGPAAANFPHTFPAALRARDRGMRMGEPSGWRRDRVGHLWSSMGSGYHIHSVKEWESSYLENCIGCNPDPALSTPKRMTLWKGKSCKMFSLNSVLF